ncbi:hypothetical protein FGADI_9359 [Fusarium gaditjirri]|uniref:MACPF-like domain-containing protein n=1 Tax=Fusarium gaditjirri TaxID=282569 RepID=A0A8H4SZV1_9HYPO|nr:hypothetical protein FGADI_9359 [Fusarium gaditjirri]
MAASQVKFQIAISGPNGTIFPSFPSNELADGNVETVTLANIRSKCNISTKLFFTVDGKTRIDDQTSLTYYMTLTAEILKPDAAPVPPAAPPAVPPAAAGGAAAPVPVPAQAPPPGPGIPTFEIKVTDSTPTAPGPLALPAENATLAKLLEQASKAKFLERGALPTFSNTDLTALTQNYAGLVTTTRYPEPAELKESDWDVVLRNTRAFHGYYFDYEKGILAKAPKPAFRLRGVPKPGVPAKGTEIQMTYNPPVPPFYIDDASTVTVTEMNHQTSKLLVKEGFNSLAVGGSIGGPPKLPISISAAFDEEHSFANQKKDTTNVDSLAITYNFPRVVIELDAECLELTPECASEARNLVNQSGVDRFTRRYGNAFATSFTLGGYLFSTRSVSKTEMANLEQVKDQARKAAGLSIQTPKVSGSFGVASTTGSGKEEGSAVLHQEARLTWDACGGDTLLASNPAAWVSTVKDHRLWRLMNQQRVIQLFSLIKDLDVVAYDNLMDPSTETHTGKDPVKDKEYNEKIRTYIIKEILDSADTSELLRRMGEYYHSNKYEASPALDEFNAFMAANYPSSHAGKISPGIKWNGLSVAQRAYFGVFMASKGQLKL